MDFDFNWILVPATLVFFAIWLLDKLLFKQYPQLKHKKDMALQADQKVQQFQANFEQLKLKYPQQVISDTVNHADEPVDVTQARDHLSQVKGEAIRAHNDLNQHKINPVVNWAYDFWPVLAVVLVVRSFFFEPFNIPSESMNPTLETGDFILVNKFAYGVRLPLVNYKIIDTGEPEHGDVAVFRYPENPNISFIKRIIGLPGDHIALKNGVLYVNHVAQYQQRAGQVNLPVEVSKDQYIDVLADQWMVNLGEHRFISQYISLVQKEPMAIQVVNYMNSRNNPSYAQMTSATVDLPLSLVQNWEITVPDGQYFAMGDNRDQSADSRYWGFVPEQNLTGKATYIWMHKAPGFNIPTFKRNGNIP